MVDELLTVERAAQLLNIKPRTVREYLRKGKLEGVQFGSGNDVGRRWRIRMADINSFIDGNKSADTGCYRCNRAYEEFKSLIDFIINLQSEASENGDYSAVLAYTETLKQIKKVRKSLAIERRRELVR